MFGADWAMPLIAKKLSGVLSLIVLSINCIYRHSASRPGYSSLIAFVRLLLSSREYD